MFIHYIHFYTNWFYWEDNYSSNKGFNEKDAIWFAGDITKKQAKELIISMFPAKTIIKNIQYHESPRGHIKNGSRPRKEKYNYKRERNFKNKNQKRLSLD